MKTKTPEPFDRDALAAATEDLARSFGISTARRMCESLRLIAEIVEHAEALMREEPGQHSATRRGLRARLDALGDDDRRLLGMDR
jgi:hypothetical protein